VETYSRLIVVVGGAESPAASAAAAITAAATAASAAAACEVGEPSPSLVRVRTRAECVACVWPAPAAHISRIAGAGAARLWGGGAFLHGCLLGDGLGDQVRLHPLGQLHCQLGIAGLCTMDRVTHPVCYHSVQDLVSRGAALPDQQVAGVEHGAVGELDADRLPDQVQLVHDVELPLPDDVVLDNEVDTVLVVFTTRYQVVARERGEYVNSSLAAQLRNLVQCRVHRPEEDPGRDGQITHHMVFAVLQLLDGADGPVTGHVHEARVVHGVDDHRRVRFVIHSASNRPLMMLTLAGVKDQPLDVTSTAGLPMLSRDTLNLPALLPPTMMMGASVELANCSPVDMVDDSLLTVITVSMFRL
jgi:hypothetical protein